LLPQLTNKNFQINALVKKEMHQPKTTTQYELMFISLKSYHTKFVIIESVNIRYLTSHFQNIFAKQNLLAFHILCLNETKTQNIHINQEAYNIISQKITFCHVMTNMEHDVL